MLRESKLKKLAQDITGRQNSTEALEETLRAYVQQRLGQCRQEIERLEHKYGLKFEVFAQRLGKKLPLSWEHEQDYMIWEEAVTNLQYFKKMAEQLRVHA
ncbi:MAG: hypothetical protein HYX24_07000 [Candidatus Aenigmarchaeota archaeon]|nr:hypothetical protein [Candidatus Aenigmarchaeota archaeon]